MGMKIKIHEHRKANIEEHFVRLYRLSERRHGKISEKISDWAEREVELSIKNGNSDPYGRGCLKSALKAYKSLCDDGHSGCSIGFTRQILNRLIDGLPLSAIEDVPKNWKDISDSMGTNTYQCKRMSGLFKDIDENGNVSYHDVNRVVYIDIQDDGTESSWHSGWASQLVDEVCGEIEMPYYPVGKPYKVYAKTYNSVNDEPGCYDTVHVMKIVEPNGNTIDYERFYHEDSDGNLVEIGEDEFEKYKASCLAHRN